MMEQNEVDQKAKQILGALRSDAVRPSPALKTRVLAEFRARRQVSHKIHWWRRLSVGLGSAVAVLLAVLFWNAQRADFGATVGQVLVVKLDVADLAAAEEDFAQILLPDGVEFYSDQFPQIRNRRTLVLAAKKWRDRPELAFIVRGMAPGKRTLRIQILNAQKKLKREKELKLRFKPV